MRLLLAALTLLLAGCITGPAVTPNGADEQPQLIEGPTVSHHDDGSRGFVLRERPLPDAEAKLLFAQGVAAFQSEDYELALECFDGLIETTPGNAALHIDMAMAYRRIARPELAEEHLLVALELIPGHPVASQEYGLLLSAAGRFDEARAVYQQSLENFPEYLPLRRNLGILCDLYLNDPACALEQYRAYSEYQSEDHPVQVWIAELKLRSGL